MCWGWNEHGICGTGDENNVPLPTQVALPAKRITSIGCGAGHSFALVSRWHESIFCDLNPTCSGRSDMKGQICILLSHWLHPSSQFHSAVGFYWCTKVLSAEDLGAIKYPLLKAWSWSEYSFMCSVCCPEFCSFKFCLLIQVSPLFYKSSSSVYTKSDECHEQWTGLSPVIWWTLLLS